MRRNLRILNGSGYSSDCMLMSPQWRLAFGVVLVLLRSAMASSTPTSTNGLTQKEIIQKAVERTQRGPAATDCMGYTCRKVSVTEELDPSGRVRQRKERVYQISVQPGSTSSQLVAVDGHAPGVADLKRQGENELNLRQVLGGTKDTRNLRGDGFLTEDLVSRFDFTLLEQQLVNGRAAYRLSFQPKNPGPPVRRFVDRLLNHISGTLWIDVEEFELARADVRLGAEVDFLGGVAGCLRKLAYTVTRTRVGNGLWMNTSSNGDFEGRKLLDSRRVKMKSQITGIRTLAAEG